MPGSRRAKGLRQPGTDGYARGEETRARIIAAAVECFAADGFEVASTRDIARLAEVNAPAVRYYFDSKEGLYRACAELIAERIWGRFEPAVKRAQTTLDDPSAGVPQWIDAFDDLQMTIVEHLLGTDHRASDREFVAREQAGHGCSAAFMLMRERVSSHLNRVGSELIARLTGLPADDPRTLLRMVTLHGQFLVFHGPRRWVMATLQWERIDAQRLEALKAQVREQTRLLLQAWSRTRG